MSDFEQWAMRKAIAAYPDSPEMQRIEFRNIERRMQNKAFRKTMANARRINAKAGQPKFRRRRGSPFD